jgi:hypothetical protein
MDAKQRRSNAGRGGPLRRAPESAGQATIWVCVPIYRNGVPHATIEQRRDHLTGIRGGGPARARSRRKGQNAEESENVAYG